MKCPQAAAHSDVWVFGIPFDKIEIPPQVVHYKTFK